MDVTTVVSAGGVVEDSCTTVVVELEGPSVFKVEIEEVAVIVVVASVEVDVSVDND